MPGAKGVTVVRARWSSRVDDGTRQPNVISLKEFELNFPAQARSIRYGRIGASELPAPSSQYTSKGAFHDDFLQNR